MVRAIVIILVLAGLAVFLAFKFGGVGSFDPTTQGEELKAKLLPGMTWRQVIALQEPRKYCIFHEKTRRVGGMDLTTVEAGIPIDFDETRIADAIRDGTVPYGFQFPYRFSAQCSFDATFDRNGLLTAVADTMTMADLLDTRK